MKVAKIRIAQIMGIEELEIEPGNVTVISGPNGSGKTSVLAAVKSVIEGGHDAELVRDGAEAGEVVLVLQDGTEMRKRITQAGSNLSVKHPDMGKVGKAQTWVNSLQDALSFNPVKFLTCDDAERIRYVLESSKVTLTPEQLTAAVGDVFPVPPVIVGHPLKVIEQVRKAIYDERTGHNAVARDSKATAEQLLAGLPEAVEIAADVEVLEAERQVITAGFSAQIENIRERADAKMLQITQAAEEQLVELERQMAAVRAERDRKRQVIADARAEKIQSLQAAEAQATAELVQKIAAAREARRTAEQTNNTRAVARRHQMKADAAKALADARTRAIENLDALKVELLEQAPIKGLDVRDGSLFWRDVPWQKVNHAERVKVAMQLAKHRAGDLPLICVDGLEALDPQAFAAFTKLAPKSGMQFIVTRVADGEFGIETFNAPDLEPAGA